MSQAVVRTGHPGELPSRQGVSRGLPTHLQAPGAARAECPGGAKPEATGLRAMVWKAKEQRVWSEISHLQLHNNQPLVDVGEPRASQCLAHLEYIQVGERKAPGIGPGVGSGCLSVSSQGVGPGLDQEWGKGGPLRARRQCWSPSNGAASSGTSRWGFQSGLKWPRHNPGKGVMGGTGRNRTPLYIIA